KHSGFLCAACALGVEHRGYAKADHPVQRAVKALLEDLTGIRIADEHRAVDGCSVPTWALPLSALARGFARLGTGVGLTPARASVAQRLIAACFASPILVAGEGRFDTIVMAALAPTIFVKGGA